MGPKLCSRQLSITSLTFTCGITGGHRAPDHWPHYPVTVEGSIFAAGSTGRVVGVYAVTEPLEMEVERPLHAVATMEVDQIAVQPVLLPGSVAAMLKPC